MVIYSSRPERGHSSERLDYTVNPTIKMAAETVHRVSDTWKIDASSLYYSNAQTSKFLLSLRPSNIATPSIGKIRIVGEHFILSLGGDHRYGYKLNVRWGDRRWAGMRRRFAYIRGLEKAVWCGFYIIIDLVSNTTNNTMTSLDQWHEFVSLFSINSSCFPLLSSPPLSLFVLILFVYIISADER